MKVTIDPVTRLEGHGKIEIFLDNKGNVANTYLQIPELRGFEKFCEGRRVEEMPNITSRICGVCPEAHSMASLKALDSVFQIEPSNSVKKVRELLYSAFQFTDKVTNFYILSGPDFIVGPESNPEERNILGVIKKLGKEFGISVIKHRLMGYKIIQLIGGRQIHSNYAIPGGISKPISTEDCNEIRKMAENMVNFSKYTLNLFDEFVLKNKKIMDMIFSENFVLKTYYMGTVDEKNRVNFYDGNIRIVNPEGKEVAKYLDIDYQKYIEEHVEPWTYLKFPYLKKVGWKGLVEGKESGVYSASPLSRFNAADGMATPLAQEEYEKMYKSLGGKPVHNILAAHWARLIEMMYAAERTLELINDPEITDKNIRPVVTTTPAEGVGHVEAPRGTLIHHYLTDEKGIIKKVNLIVGTTNNYASMNISIKKAAKSVIKNGKFSESSLNKIEMALRAYDPCMACATHTWSGDHSILVKIIGVDGTILKSYQI
ncbi:MAG: Ni/Fe hydrogenase subunit alpha [Candidatus Bathyarchaeota archaeon]|nr:Ni/Fe hydrogenase subunit alpha [Candidatus Bathyarchaeota archaeon]